MADLTSFEQEIFSVAGNFLASQIGEITARLQEGLSCEGYLNHLFAKAFVGHPLICVRETPYIDLDAREAAPKAALDLLVISPNKTQSALIETKQVHDRTKGFYRSRLPEHGDSIAGDIRKIAAIPSLPGRSRLVMVFMTNLARDESSADWLWWLTNIPELKRKWFRATPGDGPLFKFGELGWFDIFIHKLDQ